MKKLHLTLKKEWFDMILSGEKKEEYREIKRYWIHRLCNEVEYENGAAWEAVFKKFDVIEFKNGYGKNAPTMTVKLDGIKIGLGIMSWGAYPGVEFFVIKLGEIIETKNLTTTDLTINH